jgi:L-glyceraldehyde 3-phosphate reductase
VSRGQSLAQLAIAWVLCDPRITSAVMGASRVEQIEEVVSALAAPGFTTAELAAIDAIVV